MRLWHTARGFPTPTWQTWVGTPSSAQCLLLVRRNSINCPVDQTPQGCLQSSSITSCSLPYPNLHLPHRKTHSQGCPLPSEHHSSQTGKSLTPSSTATATWRTQIPSAGTAGRVSNPTRPHPRQCFPLSPAAADSLALMGLDRIIIFPRYTVLSFPLSSWFLMAVMLSASSCFTAGAAVWKGCPAIPGTGNFVQDADFLPLIAKGGSGPGSHLSHRASSSWGLYIPTDPCIRTPRITVRSTKTPTPSRF